MLLGSPFGRAVTQWPRGAGHERKSASHFLAEYFTKEEVETIVVGYPKTLQNEPAEVTKYINTFVGKLRKLYPDKKIELIDERFTSKMAFQTMIDSGISKKARQNKALIDQISATIILQNYLEIIKN